MVRPFRAIHLLALEVVRRVLEYRVVDRPQTSAFPSRSRVQGTPHTRQG